MDTLSVPAAWIAQGYLPRCCARHGGTATQWRTRRFYTATPIWVLALIPFGLIVALIVSTAVRRTVEGRFPECPQCSSDRRRFVAAVCGVWVLDLMCIWAAFNFAAFWLVVWLLVTAVAVPMSFSADRFRVRGEVTKDGGWVHLKGASDAFVNAINSALSPPPPPYAVIGPGGRA